VFQSTFMNTSSQSLDTLKDIRQMMERSSRFISLSGWSGVAAGCCALVGAWFAHRVISGNSGTGEAYRQQLESTTPENVSLRDFMGSQLFYIALFTFIAALILAFVFTYIRSKKNNTGIWSSTAQRLMINVSIPMIVGGLYLWKLVQAGAFGLISPGCLIFYGLALVNAGKYTLKEVRYLGYLQIVVGLVNLSFIGYGLYFWAFGFGVLHIFYGILMWWKYEKDQERKE